MLGRRRERKRSKTSLSREAALSGHPVRLPVTGKELKSGKLYLTVQYERPGWQRMLGAERTCSRTFALDPYGRSVYECCDGRTSVSEIIESFARQHKISAPEAELSVTTFMKTLVGKGLIGIQMK
jgi:hypothetical protein